MVPAPPRWVVSALGRPSSQPSAPMAGGWRRLPLTLHSAAIRVATSGVVYFTPPASNRRRPLSSQAQRFAIMLQVEGGVVVAVHDEAATETFVDTLAERHVLRFAAPAAPPGAGKIRRRLDEPDTRSLALAGDLALQGTHGSPGDSPRQTPAAPVHHVADIQRLHPPPCGPWRRSLWLPCAAPLHASTLPGSVLSEADAAHAHDGGFPQPAGPDAA